MSDGFPTIIERFHRPCLDVYEHFANAIDIHHRLLDRSHFNHYDETIFQGKTLHLATVGNC